MFTAYELRRESSPKRFARRLPQPVFRRLHALQIRWRFGRSVDAAINPFLIYDTRRAIFIHIPKAAGVSVSAALYGRDVLARYGVASVGHHSIQYIRAMSPAKSKRYFTFTFVRNPYDRLVSAFHYVKFTSGYPAERMWADAHLARIADFRAFIDALGEPAFRAIVIEQLHFRPQIDFVTAASGERPAVDVVGRFERLADDYASICGRLGVSVTLPPRDNAGDHRPYAEYYDARARAVVAAMYAEDFAVFQYPA